MLDFKRALGSAKAPERSETAELMTPWGEALDPEHVLEEHPRPTMVRERYSMLNGEWDYAIVKVAEAQAALSPDEGAQDEPDPMDEPLFTRKEQKPAALSPAEALKLVSSAPEPEEFDGTILVPFSPEAPLSGVGRTVQPDELLWYRAYLMAPRLAADERLVLHFEAVDWACAVYADGRLAGTHLGGYLPFDVDITPCLSGPEGLPVELSLCVYDPGSAGTQLRGKQSLEPGGIWYTAQSGIWQSVWYEVLPALHLTTVSLKGAADGTLSVEAAYTDSRTPVLAPAALDLAISDAEGAVVARASFASAVPGRIDGSLALEGPHLWSPDDPYLYRARLVLRASDDGNAPTDGLESYCAFRTVEVARDVDGTPRFQLNGEPLFLKGVLDQGYWPDGLLTAPSDEALVFDIQTMRDAGFNMMRKHLKIESARWYYHCDRLGMLVWQDCVSGGGPYRAWTTSRYPTIFSSSWGAYADNTDKHRKHLSANDSSYQREWSDTRYQMEKLLDMHPSIVTWTLFNEGWGQFDSQAAAERMHRLDPTRPIDAASGWYDQHCGDYLSIHNYFRPLEVPADDTDKLDGYAAGRGCRAVMLSEFGGLAQPVEGHTFSANAYGYGEFESMDEWRAAVHGALDEAEGLEGQGLAGYVFTQLSDVEDELNGLMTYDRRVNKLAEG